jgi:hypothetical protein
VPAGSEGPRECLSLRRRDRPDPNRIITGGHDNTTARTVAFREGEPINASALHAMFRQIIANNRTGGWQKLKGEDGRSH